MMTSEFVRKVKKGSDIEFTVNGSGYTICTWTEDGISIAKWDDIKTAKAYQTVEDMLEDYPIGNKKLKDRISDVVITDYTAAET